MSPVLQKNKTFIILGLSPALLVFSLFVLYPIVRSFMYGVYSWNGLSKPVFVGLENFRQIFTDPIFWKSLQNNLFVVVASVFG